MTGTVVKLEDFQKATGEKTAPAKQRISNDPVHPDDIAHIVGKNFIDEFFRLAKVGIRKGVFQMDFYKHPPADTATLAIFGIKQSLDDDIPVIFLEATLTNHGVIFEGQIGSQKFERQMDLEKHNYVREKILGAVSDFIHIAEMRLAMTPSKTVRPALTVIEGGPAQS